MAAGSAPSPSKDSLKSIRWASSVSRWDRVGLLKTNHIASLVKQAKAVRVQERLSRPLTLGISLPLHS